MRHRVKGRTLGRSPSHRAAMLRNLVCSLMLHEKVTTTSEKALRLINPIINIANIFFIFVPYFKY